MGGFFVFEGSSRSGKDRIKDAAPDVAPACQLAGQATAGAAFLFYFAEYPTPGYAQKLHFIT